MEENNVNEVKNNVSTENVKSNLGAPKKHNNKVMKKKINIMKLLKNKIVLFGLVGLVVIITIIVLIINLLDTSVYDKYYKYEEKMNIYGFNKMYNNESAATMETVTKMEAIKMVLAVALNTDDINQYIYVDSTYEDEEWAAYANSSGISKYSQINESNSNELISYIDVIEYFNGAKDNFFSDVANDELDKTIGDINEYTLEEQIAIKTLVANDVLIEAVNDINGKDMIFKGQLNELVVNFANEYNTITFGEDNKMNIDPDNIPNNADQYPFTLANVDKSVYEIPLIIEDNVRFLSPADLFGVKRDNYEQMLASVEQYLSHILNIDYRTITIEDLTRKINSYLILDAEQEDLEAYLQYVKDNEIVMNGNALTIIPAIYSDGMTYRVRTKVTLNIENSKTDKNLLYGDKNSYTEIIYEKDNYELYVDFKMSNSINTDSAYVEITNLYDTILEKVNSGIIEKDLEE